MLNSSNAKGTYLLHGLKKGFKLQVKFLENDLNLHLLRLKEGFGRIAMAFLSVFRARIVSNAFFFRVSLEL